MNRGIGVCISKLSEIPSKKFPDFFHENQEKINLVGILFNNSVVLTSSPFNCTLCPLISCQIKVNNLIIRYIEHY